MAAQVLTFDSAAYLAQNGDVQQAVLNGLFADAFTHYVQFGQFERRDAYLSGGSNDVTFNTADYAANNEDVVDAIQSGAISDFVSHFLSSGIEEGRTTSNSLFDGLFDEQAYLDANTDVADAVAAGSFASGYEHYLAFGAAEGRAAQTVDGEVIGGGDAPGVATLTVQPDNLTANQFNAPRVFDPEGDDQTNSLQDDDVLTGTGDNPTLDFNYVTDVDTGDFDIVPTLNGIEVINIAYATDAAATLDLQDATGLDDSVNLSRIDDDAAAASVINMGADGVVPDTLSITNSNAPATNVNFTFLPAGVSADGQTIDVDLSNVSVNALVVQEVNATAGLGFETINLSSTGAANTVGSLFAEDLETLNISGDQNVTLGNAGTTTGGQGVEATVYTGGLQNVAGSLAAVNASTLAAGLDIVLGAELNAGADGTSGVAQDVTVTGGTGDDIFRLVNTTLNATDSIDGGEGANTLVMLSNSTVAGTVSNVQAAEIRSGHDADAAADVVTLDASLVPELETVLIRNEGQTVADLDGDGQVDDGTSTAEALTLNLNNLSDAVAGALTILHGTTGNNGLANNVINVDFATNDGGETVGVTIADGVNSDPRFNFQLVAGEAENVTIVDNDTESNTIQLGTGGDVSAHSGTISVAGGEVGDFLNFDATGNAQGLDTSGLAVDATFFDDIGAAAAERIEAATFDASAYVGNVTVRVGSNPNSTDGAQSVTMGSGDDQVIFDVVNAAEDTAGTAGLTGADTVAAGDGTDTLVLDGNGRDIIVQQSEWDNLSGFENLRLAGNGAGNTYRLQLDNDFIAANNDGTALNIINDDGSDVDTTTNVDADANNTAAVIFANQLSANNHFTYDGEEGSGATADRFVLNDANTNGGNVIDGGNVDVIDLDGDGDDDTAVTSGDVLEVRNTATVTTSDLANVSNVGTIVINNTEAVQQTLNLTLNSTVVDNLVDGGHAATTDEIETLTIIANDGLTADEAGNPLAPLAAAAIDLDARNISGAFALNIQGDTAFNGNDTVELTVRYGGGQHTIDLAGGTDSVTISGLDPNGTVARDDVDESILIFTNAEGQEVRYSIADVAQGEVTLEDTDGNPVTIPDFVDPNTVAVTVAAVDATVDEGGTAQLTLTPDVAPNTDVVVDLALTFGTADAADVTVVNTTVTLPAGATDAVTVDVATIVDDAETEDAETFTVDVSTTRANTTFDDADIDFTINASDGAENVIDLSEDADGVVDAVAGTAEVFLLDFDSTDGTIAVSDDAVVTINGFDPAEDILRFDDAQATPISEADFLNAALVAENGFAGTTTINFSDPDGTDAVPPAVITLAGIVDDTLGGATPFFEVV